MEVSEHVRIVVTVSIDMKYPAKPSNRDQHYIRLGESLKKAKIAPDPTCAPAEVVPAAPRAESVRRHGGKESYHGANHVELNIPKPSSERGYRVVTYEMTESGDRVVRDITTGAILFAGSGKQRKISNNAVMFETKSAAMSERFPNRHVSCLRCHYFAFSDTFLLCFFVFLFFRKTRIFADCWRV